MNKCSDAARPHFSGHKSQASSVLMESESTAFYRIQLQSRLGTVQSELNHKMVTSSDVKFLARVNVE